MFGWPQNPPERAWRPWLGHWCHLAPGDVGSLTCEQLMACWEFAEAASGAGDED